MRFDIITLFPNIFDALKNGITGRAIDQQLIELHYWNPRDFTQDPHKRVDDRPYGGGPGMVMQYQPIHDAIVAAKKDHASKATVLYLSPQGKLLTQKQIRHFAENQAERLIILAGRYEGIDERLFIDDIDAEWSIGD